LPIIKSWQAQFIKVRECTNLIGSVGRMCTVSAQTIIIQEIYNTCWSSRYTVHLVKKNTTSKSVLCSA